MLGGTIRLGVVSRANRYVVLGAHLDIVDLL
jgi:hypothetical protein